MQFPFLIIPIASKRIHLIIYVFMLCMNRLQIHAHKHTETKYKKCCCFYCQMGFFETKNNMVYHSIKTTRCKYEWYVCEPLPINNGIMATTCYSPSK